VPPMTEFYEQEMPGARFQKVDLRNASFTEVHLTGARLRDVDLSDADLRAVALHRVRMRGVELAHVEISGELKNVVINGVEVSAYVEAELDGRMPDRAKMRPVDADGFREAWGVLERLWAGTVARARTFSEADLHRPVGDEWSFIQTLRHLGFATGCWVNRMVLGDPAPWHPLDLPWDEAPRWDGFTWDREARPPLDEVLALRAERQAMVRGVLGSLTDERLASTVSCTAPGFPQLEDVTVAECLRVVLNEEWEHRLYAERDLDRLSTDTTDTVTEGN
jgi:hypothetical protein